MTETAVAEFPFVAELPKRQQGKVRTLWDHLSEAKKLVEEHGMLIPCTYAAELAGIHRSRIHQLCEDGQLHSVYLNSARFVTESSFVAWVNSERKNGRPFKAPTVKESMTMAKRLVKDSRK